MSGITAALTIIGVLAGLLAAAAAIVAFFRVNLAKATIDTLRDSNEALTHRVAELEAEDKRKTTELEHLKQEAETLRTVVSGAEILARLERELTEHHREVKDELRAIRQAVGIRGTG